MRYQKINRELFINNRFKFNQKTSDNSLTVFNSNDQMPTNADGTMPFKQNSDLFWMTSQFPRKSWEYLITTYIW